MRRTQAPSLLKQELYQEFSGLCAYCETPIDIHGGSTIEHFCPQRAFPGLSADHSNLVLACQPCNVSKADRFPLAPDGTPLLLHPRVDLYSGHIEIRRDGVAHSLTDRGAATIAVLNLNRPELVERRRLANEEAAYFLDYDANPPKPFEVFSYSLNTIRSLAKIERASANERQYLRNILFANAISALEAYLSDTLILAVTRDTTSLRGFVESFHDFKKEKFDLRDVFQRYDDIQDHSVSALRALMFHDLPKIAAIYRDALGISFPGFGPLHRAVLIRHDIVHRNGKNKDGARHKIDPKGLEGLCVAAESFVADVERQLRTSTSDSDGV